MKALETSVCTCNTGKYPEFLHRNPEQQMDSRKQWSWSWISVVGDASLYKRCLFKVHWKSNLQNKIKH